MPTEDDDEPASGPPPHPLDRTWLHPAEYGTFTRPVAPARRSRRDWLLVLAAGSIGALLTVGVLAIAGVFEDEPSRTAARSEPSQEQRERAAELAAAVATSVIAVRVTGAETRSGSGVIIDAEGGVVTSAALVAGAQAAEIIWSTGEPARATVVGVDPETDLALLRVDGATATAAPLGTTTGLRAGQMVVAVGAGHGDQQWVASGVVSALGSLARGTDGTMLAGLIETDTAVADTARGGALVDAAGTVVGVITSGSSTDDRPAAYAMPIEAINDVVAQLDASGHASHGWLGIAGEDVRNGVRVREVAEASPALAAGITAGDVVTTLDGQPVDGMGTLLWAVRQRRPGTTMALVVEHDGRPTTMLVTLTEKPAS